MVGLDDEGDAAVAIEVDAHVGLLIHAVTIHGQSCAIVLAAIRELVNAFDQPALSRSTKTSYTMAFIETGALVALWGQLAAYFDREEFVESALKLLTVLLDTIGDEKGIGLPSCKGFLDAAALIARYSTNHNQLECAQRLLLAFERLLRHLKDPTEFAALVDIVTRIMVAPCSHADILAKCLRCISEVVLTTSRVDAHFPSFKLSTAAVTVMSKVLATRVNQADHPEGDSVRLAMAVLPVLLSLLEEKRETEATMLSPPLVLAVLFAVTRVRDLKESEARIIETYIGDPFHYVVKQFCDRPGSRHAPNDTTREPSLEVTRNLAFALLWSSHATTFIGLSGTSALLRTMEGAVASRNVDLAVSAACSLHHLCATAPKAATNALEHGRSLERLVQMTVASVGIGSDDLVDHLLAVTILLSNVDRFTATVVDAGGCDVIQTILRDRSQFTSSARRAIRLLASMQKMREGTFTASGNSSLVAVINESRDLLDARTSKKFLVEYASALTFSWDACEDPGFVEGAAKDLVRMMRSNIDNDRLLFHTCELVLRLVKHSGTRRELIDSGIVQIVAKAMYLHRQQDLQQSLGSIMIHTLHVVDGTRNASILQTLVQMWKQSLTPPSDMDTFVESLELSCYVIAAITRLNVGSESMPLVEVWTNLSQILRNSIEDDEQLPPRGFPRIVQCCVHALQHLVSNRALVSPFGSEKDAAASARDGKRDAADASLHTDRVGDVLKVVVECVGKMIDRPGAVESSALLDCCQFVCQVLSGLAWTADVSDRTGWVRIASKILMHDSSAPALLEPVLCSLTSLLARSRPNLKDSPSNVTFGGMVSVLVEVLERLASRGPSVNATNLLLALQCLDVVAWDPAFRSHALVTRCLVSINQVLVAFRSSPSTVLDLCISIAHGLSSEQYVESAVQHMRRTTERLLGSSKEDSTRAVDDKRELSERCVCLAVMLTVDQRRPIFKKMYQRQWIAQLAGRLSRTDLSHNDSVRSLMDAVVSSYHVLSSPDQADLVTVCLDRVASGQRPAVVWLPTMLTWTEHEVSRCVDALTESMARCLQQPDVVRFSRLGESLLCILRHRAWAADTHASALSETTRMALSAMCETALKQHMDDDAVASWDLRVVAALVGTQAYILRDTKAVRALGIDVERLATACVRALNDCLFQSAATTVDDSICQSFLFESLLESSSVVLQAYVAESADQARALLQDAAVQQLLQQDPRCFGHNYRAHVRWCAALAASYLQEHGAIFGEKVFKLLPSPAWMITEVLSFRGREDVGDQSRWRGMMDCVAASVDCRGWGQLSLQEHIDLVVQAMTDILQRAGRRSSGATSLVSNAVQAMITRLSLVLSSLLMGQCDTRGTAGDTELPETCARVATLARELYQASSLFSGGQYTTMAIVLLRITQCTIRNVAAAHRDRIVLVMAKCLVRPLVFGTSTLSAYLDLATTRLLLDRSALAVERFLTDCPGLLRRMMHDAEIRRGDRDGRCFRALEMAFGAVADCFRDERTDAATALLSKVADVCASSPSVQELLWSCLFKLPDGVDVLLDVGTTLHYQASATPESIILFLHRQSVETRHKPVRADQQELQFLLDVISGTKNHVDVDTAPDRVPSSALTQRTPQSCASTESALGVLKYVVRLKRCAVACCAVGGFEVLYDLLSSSAQDEGNVALALEVCCYLTSYEENLVNSMTVFPLIKLLCLITDLPERSRGLARLAFVIVDQCITLAPAQFTYSLTQIARAHLWKWKGQCGDEEIDAVIQKLYPVHVRLSQGRSRSLSQRDVTDTVGVEPGATEQIAEEETAIRDTLARYYSIVQVPASSGDTNHSYIDVKTSIKSAEPSSAYLALHSALYRVRDLVEDQRCYENADFTREILPSIASIIVFHASDTTDVVCVAMEIAANLSFILEHELLVNLVDVHALLGSCYLHAVRSLPFALHAASFCANLIVDARSDITHNCRAMLKLVFALLEHHPEDFDITQSSMSCLSGLLTKVGSAIVVSMQEKTIQQLGRVLRHHAHDISVTWKAVACLHQLAPRAGRLTDADVVALVSILLNVVVAHARHAFVARMALLCIGALEQRNEQATVRQALLEQDAIGVLVDAVSVHLVDEAIVSTSLNLLIGMLAIGDEDTTAAALASIVEKRGHLTMLAVCRRHADSLSIGSMAFELLLSTIEGNGMVRDMATGPADLHSATTWHDRALQELLAQDILQLMFDTFDSAAHNPEASSLLVLLLEMLCDILCTENGRDACDAANGLLKLRQIVDVVWGQRRDVRLLEAALDCLVNAACSTHFNLGWCDLPTWLTSLADSLHEQGVSLTSVEKIVGVLLRLAVHASVAAEIARACSQTLVQILALVGDHVHLEEHLLALLRQLCFDPTNVPVLIIFDVVATLLERVAVHIECDDEVLLYTSLRLVATMASHTDCGVAFHEKALLVLLTTVTENPRSSARLQQVAHEIKDRVPVFAGVSLRKMTATVATRPHALSAQGKPGSLRPPEPYFEAESAAASDTAGNNGDNSDSELSPHREILWRGAVFRMRRDPKQAKKRDKVVISLGESEEYLLVRNMSADPPTVERVFFSQLQVLPNANAAAAEDTSLASQQSESSSGSSARRKLSLPKALSVPSLVRSASSRAECIFHVMIKKELVSLEANSPKERRAWEDALLWILQREDTAASL